MLIRFFFILNIFNIICGISATCLNISNGPIILITGIAGFLFFGYLILEECKGDAK